MKKASTVANSAGGRPTGDKRKHSGARAAAWRWAGAWSVVIGATGAGVLAVSLLSQRDSAGLATRQEPPAKAENVVGRIQFAPKGDTCRQVQIDNKTGRLSDKGRIACKEVALPADVKEMIRQRYSSGRLDSIRDSFSGR